VVELLCSPFCAAKLQCGCLEGMVVVVASSTSVPAVVVAVVWPVVGVGILVIVAILVIVSVLVIATGLVIATVLVVVIVLGPRRLTTSGWTRVSLVPVGISPRIAVRESCVVTPVVVTIIPVISRWIDIPIEILVLRWGEAVVGLTRWEFSAGLQVFICVNILDDFFA